MKRSTIFLTIAGVLLGLCLIAAAVVRDVKYMIWVDYTPGEIKRLAVAIQEFHRENGFYPTQFSELFTTPTSHDDAYLKRILAGQTLGNQYNFKVVTNGFVITAKKSAGLFSKRAVMEKHYEIGRNF